VQYGGLKIDNNLRADSTVEKLAKLRPAYDKSSAGTLTAGNSTPLTDGASCVLVATEDWARSRGVPVQAYLTCSAAAAVDFVGTTGAREGLLMAPTYAVPNMLDRMGIALQDFDICEIHEAFAAQVLCTLKAWESEYCRISRIVALGSIDQRSSIPKGSLAAGHPFAATGTRIVATLAKQLAARGSGAA
jgi:acetyl-CoA C-acetyltransferase